MGIARAKSRLPKIGSSFGVLCRTSFVWRLSSSSKVVQLVLTSRLVADDATHSRMRRLLSHAFSESALQEQELLITSYINLLIQKLHEQIDGPTDGVVDIVRWYNFTTFDLVGDLCFGESFHALESGEYHYWISAIFRGIKLGSRLQILNAYPTRYLGGSLRRLFPSLVKARERLNEYAQEKTEARLRRQTDRRDFMT